MNNYPIPVIIDTREQIPWTFERDENITTISKKLDVGDYSIVDFENELCIDRKMSVAEFASNITEKRFERLLERMSTFPHKFLLFEFDLKAINDYPSGANIPLNKRGLIKIKAPFILSSIARIQLQYDIHILFCSHRLYAEQMAARIIKSVYDRRFNN